MADEDLTEYLQDNEALAFECPEETAEEDAWQEGDSLFSGKVKIASGAGCTATITVKGNFAKMHADVDLDGATWGCSLDKGETFEWYRLEGLEEAQDQILCSNYDETAEEVTLLVTTSPAGGSKLRIYGVLGGISDSWPVSFNQAIPSSIDEPQPTTTAAEETSTTFTEGTTTTAGETSLAGAITTAGATTTAAATATGGSATVPSTAGAAPSSTTATGGSLTSTTAATSKALTTTEQSAQSSSSSTAVPDGSDSSDSSTSMIGGLSNMQLGLIVGGVVLIVVAIIVGVICMRKPKRTKGDPLLKDEERSLQKAHSEKGTARGYISTLTPSYTLRFVISTPFS
ncbi:hypothetical protein JCM6882_004778 [Rhodosporidiobolus microsporus]